MRGLCGIVLGVCMVTALHGFAAERPVLSGKVAYTEPLRFDYTKDGKKNNVQFWLEFKGQGAIGKPGEAGYEPASGAIFYYLLDLDTQQKVTNWLMGFSMMSEPPPSGPYPMSDLVIEGNTARFEAFKMKWVITDGGQGCEKDQVMVDDGFKPRPMKLYAGDLQVSQ